MSVEICYALVLDVLPSDAGEIVADPEPNCSVLPDKYQDGTSVSLTANPNTSFDFGNWGGSLSTSENPAQVTIDADKAVTANFIITECTFSGKIDLQGRYDDSGPTSTAGAYLPTSDTSGYYELNVPEGIYDVTAEIDLYLDGEKMQENCPVGGTNKFPDVTLLVGDANDDCTINILDLPFMGVRYGLSDGDPGFDPQAGINDDGTEDILVLTMAGGNFLKE